MNNLLKIFLFLVAFLIIFAVAFKCNKKEIAENFQKSTLEQPAPAPVEAPKPATPPLK